MGLIAQRVIWTQPTSTTTLAVLIVAPQSSVKLGVWTSVCTPFLPQIQMF